MNLIPKTFGVYQIQTRRVSVLAVKYEDISYDDFSETHEVTDYEELFFENIDHVEKFDMIKKEKKKTYVGNLKECDYFLRNGEIYMVMHILEDVENPFP